MPIDPIGNSEATSEQLDLQRQLTQERRLEIKAQTAQQAGLAKDAAARSEVLGPNVHHLNKQRQTAQAAIAFHLGNRIPGMDWSPAVTPIANRFLEMTKGDPALTAALEDDVNTLFALTDKDIVDRIARGEPLSQFGDVFDSIAEVAWEVGATELAATLEAEKADAIGGKFDALTGVEALQLANPEAFEGGAGQLLAGRSGGAVTTKAQSFQTLFDVPGAWSFSKESGVLAVTIGDETIGVEARPGFDPESHLDVLAEVVSAQANGRVVGGKLTPGHQEAGLGRMVKLAHDVGGFLDESPTARRSIDTLWSALTVNPTGVIQAVRGEGDLSRASDALRDEKGSITEDSVRLASVVPLPVDAIIASIARGMMADASEAGVELGSGDALGMAAEIVDDQRDELLDEFRNLTQKQLVEELEAEVEGKSALGRVVEDKLDTTLQAFEWWDDVTQMIGVGVIDLVKDILGTAGGFLTGDTEFGFESLKKIIEAPTTASGSVFGVRASEYFGLEGGAAEFADLAVGAIFDPFNYVFAGAKGVRALAARALTNPKYARLYLRMGSYRSTIETIVRGGTKHGLGSSSMIVNDLEDALGRMSLGGADESIALNAHAAGELTEEVVRRVEKGEGLRNVLEELRASTVTAEESAIRAVKTASSMSGLDTTDMLDLVDLALDPNATREQVENVLVRAMSKDYLGEGPMRAQRHSTVEGIGRMLESVADGKISDEHLGAILTMFSKADVGRTFRLGENQALDHFADILTELFPRDQESYVKWFREAVERVRASGDQQALAGANALLKEQGQRRLYELGGPTKAITAGDDLRGIDQNLGQIEEALGQVDSLGLDKESAAAIREQLKGLHGSMSQRLNDAKPKLARIKGERRAAKKKIDQAVYLEQDLANATRNEMASVVYEMYEGVAQRIEKNFGEGTLPIIKGATNPLAPGTPVRDWSAVTGIKGKLVGTDDDLRLMMGLAVDDTTMSKNLDAVGMFNTSQKVLLPASPYQILLYERIAGNPKLYAKITNLMRGERVKKIVGAMKFVFAANLLVNPLTAGKITLDETLRFFADTGELGKFFRSTAAGMPGGVGRISENVYQMFSSSTPNPFAQQYRRNVGGWAADDYANFDWVVNPGRRAGSPGFKQADFREQAERWVNGTLLQDKRFREYARWVEAAEVLEDGTRIAPPGFVDWWENGTDVTRPGKAEARTTTVSVHGEVKHGTELTAQEAFNIIDQSFHHWLDLLVDPKRSTAMRSALLKAATSEGGRLDVVKDATLLNSIKQVPGLSGKTGPGTTVFNVFFGAPSGRRAGVFFEHYFDEAYNILKARHGDRLLTAEKVADFAKVDLPTAQFYLKQGTDNQVVGQLVRQQGFRLDSQIRARAAAYAERRADDLMYRFTASSLAGRGVEAGLMFPFARAQMDFLSWWGDHLTKPMTVKMSLEARSRMPRVAKAVEALESIPVNGRALAKFSHIVAAVNNDNEDSMIDQLINNLTFFPARFDHNFLLSITPQLGFLPSWMVDLMVDQGRIDDEALDAIETLFPALEFTEIGDGGVLEEMFNRIVPTSRRSLRDMAGSTIRAMYALFGEDVHTKSGLDASVVNILTDGKRPAATGDFQVALVADFLKGGPDDNGIWDLVPGSEEFDAKIKEIAVQGAVEANKEEWGQDWKDRVNPLSGYDAEYRALKAYDVMFSDGIFSALVNGGVFESNDLLEIEGQPRIKAIWDKYQEGTATVGEMKFLDDRLTSAYFDAGRAEVYPGFSYQDYLHLVAPELSVNLIAKNEDSGIPVRTDDHQEFKTRHINKLTGRLQNVPPGPQGAEMVSEARKKGWLVSRPVEDWAFDAAAAVYKSGARAVHGVWEWVSHRTWQQGSKKSLDPKTFTLGEREAKVLDLAGLHLEAGQEFTYGEFHQLLDDFDERFDVAQPLLINTIEKGAIRGQLAKDPYGLALLDGIKDVDKRLRDNGIESVEDWPEETKTAIRDAFNESITLGLTTPEDYAQEMEHLFGPLDYEPPTPPARSELKDGIVVAGDDLEDMSVIDGDTVSILLADGPMRVRVIGINSPEVTQDGFAEARDQLARVIDQASEVVLAVYKPELFGLTQVTAPGEQRLLAWLYVDGVPLYDPSVFGVSNPRGAGVGGTVIDLEEMMRVGKAG